ncbi:hypothetical protein G7Z17_g5421 [Cylindrodendrum hubeiense]|uniref:Uncharacterized protein n=1 Tax=Cylindrodendrum hubeiense TaxID=595255 RepID=A0A9P5LG67_9HYPO|nr:hypothetical protein G7Z17_g5421 [Cylindrodendrum hubeiense]
MAVMPSSVHSADLRSPYTALSSSPLLAAYAKLTALQSGESNGSCLTTDTPPSSAAPVRQYPSWTLQTPPQSALARGLNAV